jgi:hypothetical protein
MKETILFTIGLILISSGWINAQSVPPPPKPIVETDLRDNSIRMRSIELERIKREAAKPGQEAFANEQGFRFAATKEKFERIQKLQDSIIKAYTTGKRINYGKISRLASDIKKKSLWLDKNLFGAKQDKTNRDKQPEAVQRKSVRDLIIELDKSIGDFVKSPIFQDSKVVELEISEAAQLELRKVMKLSYLLSIESKKMK